jgi:hypothetical protein
MDTSSNITRREVIQNLVFATANVGLLQFVSCTSQSSDDKTFDTKKTTNQTDKMVSNMEDFSINENGELEIFPSQTSSHTDFDFYIGKWNIRNKKLKERLNNCDEWIEFNSTDDTSHLLKGFANMNKFAATFDGEPFEGIAIRLFNPQTKLWSIYWADSNAVSFDPPMVGSFDGNIGKLYCKDKFKGRDIIVLFHWDKTDIDNPIWSQAFSTDNGKTWEWNWYMYASRIK